MSPRRLKRLFHYYNRRYFAGALPSYRIRLGRLLCMACCDRYNRILRFDPRRIRGRRMWRILLLHEMAHIRARPGHGKTFFEQLCLGPSYAVLYECGGDKKLFAFLKYGRKSEAYEQS
jgi:hypothetical protein